jgi:hypothetical protein
MAAANGFVAASPDAAYGDAGLTQTANIATAQKYVAGGSGVQELTELGLYGHGAGGTVAAKISVYTHDAANDCPNAMVTNSELTLSLTGTEYVKVSASYGVTKPTVTGGDTYWLCVMSEATIAFLAFATSGELEVGSVTYPTWPTGDAWHTHSHYTYDLSLYAVYTAYGGSLPLPVILGHYRQRRS